MMTFQSFVNVDLFRAFAHVDKMLRLNKLDQLQSVLHR